MKFMKRLLSTVTAAVIGASMVTSFAGGCVTVTAADQSALDLVEDMGLGWNLGNALDGTNTWTSSPSPSDIETAWGNVVTTEAMIREVKKAGFNTVRIPVTWWDMTGAAGTANMDSFDGTVGDAYLARVKEVVDYCIDNGMYAIINTHHDEDWEKNTAQKSKFEKLWKQIATYFKDYDQHLVFEGMNEVSFSTSDAMTYNQAFVDTVRATGGNNATRLLICTADSNNTDKALSSSFSMPTDPANMLAVSVHYYEPPQFCVADTTSSWGHSETWGTGADYTTLENDFNALEDKFIDSGVGVIIGEYGVCNADKYGVNTTPYNKDQESIEKFLKAVASTAYSKTGMCPVVWDDSDSGTISLFSRKNLSWFDDSIKQIFVDIASGNQQGNDKDKTDRITISGADLVNEDGDMLVDLKPYKDLGVSVSSVVVDYNLTSSKGNDEVSAGLAMSFNVLEEGSGETVWCYLQDGIGISDTTHTFNIPSDNYYVLETDSKTGEVTKDVTGPMDMDYLKFEKWWDWSSATGDKVTLEINKVTVIFDKYFYTDNPVTTDDTTDTTEETTTTTTAETTTESTATTVSSETPDEYIGVVYPAGQAGTYQFWGVDDEGVQPAYITGDGEYSCSYQIPEGDGTGSIECLILDSDINAYQFFEENYTGKDVANDCGVKFEIQSITLDGVEIDYANTASMCTGNDGVSLRKNILNTWTTPKISDIDGSEITLTSELVINFKVSGIGGGEITTTESTTTSETTTTETTTTSSSVIENPDVLYGDVNLDARIDLTDAIVLNKYCADVVELTETQLLNADCTADGGVDSNDSIALLRFLVHIINSLPGE